jgi:hypothetical protein
MGRVILWVVLMGLLLRSLVRLFQGVLEGAGYTRDSAAQRSVGLVRDPVCGVFVVPGRALTAGEGSERRHFCSEKCRRAWKAR